MARQLKKAPDTPVRDAILASLSAPTLDRLWPLPVAYRCSRCGMATLTSGRGACKRENKHHVRICRGWGEQIKVYRARCRCTSWTVSEKQLLSRCSLCHRRIEEWDADYLLLLLTRAERGPDPHGG